MSSWKPGCSNEVLQKRAELLHKVRTFFRERGVLEVESPSVSRYPAIDLHLDAQIVEPGVNAKTRYLISSPEYHMKRMLCAGSGSIFQICKVFRQDEVGQRHNPEFTMIEWYRIDWDHWQLMEETEALLQCLLGCEKAERLSYRDAFLKFSKLDPFQLTTTSFRKCCQDYALSVPGYLTDDRGSRDDRLNFLMGVLIEPQLGLERPVFIYDYPASQANLSRINPKNKLLCERFELFYKGMELGNGFHELADVVEQTFRFQKENHRREEAGKTPLPIDQEFLDALASGLPDCAGIAIGFDRIVMLALNMSSISEAISFPWDRA